MMAMQGQSNLSSWFFIESAEISKIKVNVSISLSSRVLNAGQDLGGEEDEVSRALGASGYQLVNVSKVEISLGKWLLGNDPSFRGKRTSNGFLSQRALLSNLTRHYTREGLKEAHKVLGGSGPAVASVPLAVLWAGGSAVVLLHEVSLGKAGPLGIAQQFIYLPIMTISMFYLGSLECLQQEWLCCHQSGFMATVKRCGGWSRGQRTPLMHSYICQKS